MYPNHIFPLASHSRQGGYSQLVLCLLTPRKEMFPALRNPARLRPLIRHIQKDQLQPHRLQDRYLTRCFMRIPPDRTPGLRSPQQRRYAHDHRAARPPDVAGRQAEQLGNVEGAQTNAVYEAAYRLVISLYDASGIRVGPDRLITSVLSRLSPLVTRRAPFFYSRSPVGSPCLGSLLSLLQN